MVSPIFKKNIYVDSSASYKKGETPIDFFNYDANMYKHLKQVKFLDTILNAGDCMYVPAFYYIQSKTTYQSDNKESIIITTEYPAHSQMLDLIFDGLEGELMTDN